MRRWTLRLTFALLALLLVAVVTVQAVLWTDLPKRLVLGQIQKQLGLKVDAASLRTGWTGVTALSDVTLSLPLAEDSFLDVPRMTVRHTSLPMLLITRSVSIDAIELDQPNLAVRRDAAGRWNVADVAELVARAGGKENQTPTGTPKLPAVTITAGTVVVNDATIGRRETIAGLNVTGRRDGPLVYRYDVKISDRVSVVGQVAPGAPWKHEVDATMTDVAAWLKPWVQQLPDDATVTAEWRGQLDGDGKVYGRLHVAELRAGKVGAKGAVAVRDNGDGSVTAEPVGLSVTTGQPALPEVQLASGRIVADAKGIRAERLLVSGIGGQARVDGNYALLTGSGELTAEWTDLLLPKVGIRNLTGSLKAELSTPFPGRPQLKAKFTTDGVTPDGPFATTLAVDGSGRAGWGEMDWRVLAEKLDWNGNYPLSFDGSLFRVETTHRPATGAAIVRLLGVEKPGEPIDATGEIDLSTGVWKAWLNAGAIDLPRSKEEMAVAVNAWGTPDHVRLEQFYLRVSDIELWSQGWYVFDRPKPVELDVLVRNGQRHKSRRAADPAAAVATSDAAAALAADAPPPSPDDFVLGTFRADFHLSGTAAAPRDLALTGAVRAADLRVGGRLLDEVKADLSGHVDNHGAAVVTEQLELLKGRWDVEALYDGRTRGVTVGVKVADLPADAVAQFAGQRGAEGTVNGQWTINLPSVVGGFDALGLNGSLVATGVKAGAFVADRIDARTSLDRGTFYVNDIRATRRVVRPVGDGEAATDGRIDASAKLAIARPTQVAVAFLATNWPVRVDRFWVDLSGGAERLTIDAAAPAEPGATDALAVVPRTLAARGNVSLTAMLTAGRGSEVALGTLQATLNGRELDLRQLRVQTAGGVIEGNALADADYPLDSTLAVSWRDVDSVMLADLFPAAVGLGGTYSGSFRVEPSKDDRALEPLRFSVDLRPTDGRYRDVQFGDMRIRGYTNLDRVVLADLTDTPSELHLAGGTVRLWGRLSSHAAADTKNVVSTQMTVVLNDLSLDQIVKTGSPDADDMPGRINGRLTVVGSTRPVREMRLKEQDEVPLFLEHLSKSMSAQGRVELSQSDLANVDAFAALYNLMNLGQNVRTPTGSGSAEILLEGGSLYVNNLRYFNRGTEIRALATIDEVWRLPKSPVSGTAVGNARPFSQVRLPLFSTFDRVLTLAQPTGVAIGGTVADPKIRPTAFDDVGDAMKAFVVGDAKKATGK